MYSLWVFGIDEGDDNGIGRGRVVWREMSQFTYTDTMVQKMERNEGRYYEEKNEKNGIRVLVR